MSRLSMFKMSVARRMPVPLLTMCACACGTIVWVHVWSVVIARRSLASAATLALLTLTLGQSARQLEQKLSDIIKHSRPSDGGS